MIIRSTALAAQELVRDSSGQALDDAKSLLTRQHPVWHLDLVGTVIESNAAMGVLWGAVEPGKSSDSTELHGRNCFRIFKDALDRIPLDNNDEYIFAKLWIIEYITKNFPHAPEDLRVFRECIFSLSPDLKNRYKRSETTPEKVYNYTLCVLPPSWAKSKQPLVFKTVVSNVYREDKQTGFIADYRPADSRIRTRWSKLMKQTFPSMVKSDIGGDDLNKEVDYSKFRYRIVPQPDITLYVDGSPDSQRAFEYLERAKLRFQVEYGLEDVPRAEFGGVPFQGAEAIKGMATILDRARSGAAEKIRKARPDIASRADHTFGQWLKKRADAQREQARRQMQSIIERSSDV